MRQPHLPSNPEETEIQKLYMQGVCMKLENKQLRRVVENLNVKPDRKLLQGFALSGGRLAQAGRS